MAKFFIIIAGIVGTIMLEDIETLFQFNFFVLCFYLVVTVVESKFIKLYHVWIIGFIYVIIPEGVIDARELSLMADFGIIASKYICFCNWSVIFAHNIFIKEPLSSSINEKWHYKKGNFTLPALLIIYVLYIFITAPLAIQNFLHGRVSIEAKTSELSFLISSTVVASGFILPGLIAYYFKYLNRVRYSFFISLLISLPIFILLFMKGTRFPLLFSLGGFFLTYVIDENLSLKKIILLVPAVLILAMLSNKMTEFRTFGVGEPTSIIIEQKEEEEKSFYDFGSIEGVISANAKLIDYFQHHDHMWGASNSFLFYFWVPRSVWENKPQMLGFWFIRDYEDANYDSGHSISFSFAGDAYADFGFAGGILFCALLGFLLAKFDQWTSGKLKQTADFSIVLVSVSYSYVFFFVRSPLTSSINFIGIIFFYYLLKKTLHVYRIIPKQNEASIHN